MVELTVVKPKYKKECVKKGMRGCVMREYAIKGQWQIKYSKKKCLLKNTRYGMKSSI